MSHAREELAAIRTFPQLVAYLRDELDWPIHDGGVFEDQAFFDYSPEELGIDSRNVAKIQEIKRLRPLAANQPWGIFFVKFEPKHLPVVALRRILSGVVLKKRASANSPDHAAWATSDLLFISNYGEGNERQISFAHFAEGQGPHRLATLKVLGWSGLATPLHLEDVAEVLASNLAWPDDEDDVAAWRSRWEGAFTLGYREVVSTSRDMASRLAKLARVLRERITGALLIETDQGPLKQLMKAVQVALVHDLDDAGFADMYAQTIAYGLLSARIADPESETATDLTGHMRTNPLLRDLLETFMSVGGQRSTAGGPGIDFDELGVAEVVDLLSHGNMEAVLRDFGDRNPEDDPVIRFYEQFLTEYDEKQRMQRSVFYTPRQVVSYIVRSVDDRLRNEFGLADGLADTATWAAMMAVYPGLKLPVGVSAEEPFVQVLDPATGTGTFLVEAIELIHTTLRARWSGEGRSEAEIRGLWNSYVPAHLLPRLHGFELLMAPYAIAHMKLGLKLYETGYRFRSDERVRVYLTNSLDAAQDYSDRLDFAIPALAHEAKAVNEVKRHSRFTVVIGNPPYSLISANMEPEHRALVERYKFIGAERIHERGALQLEKILNDDYVKFLAKAQDWVAEANVGCVGLITNHAYLDNPTMRGLRANLLSSFDTLAFLDLGGSTKKASGDQDENVFDIQQGVAIAVLTRRATPAPGRAVYARIAGSRADKYATLSSRVGAESLSWAELAPSEPFFRLVPSDDTLRREYEAGTSLEAIFGLKSIGLFTSKDSLVVGWNADEVTEKVEFFRNSRLSNDDLCAAVGITAKDAWNVSKSRQRLAEIPDVRDHIVRFKYRPFDERYLFYDKSLVWSMAAPVNRNMSGRSNIALTASRQLAAPPWNHVFCSDTIIELCFITNKTKEGNHAFPLFLMPEDDGEQTSMLADREPRANLRPDFVRRLADALGRTAGSDTGSDAVTPREVFDYLYAVLHSPTYRERYVNFLGIDFPRVPIPGTPALFGELAKLGNELTTLHLSEPGGTPASTVSFIGPMRPTVGRAAWSGDTVWLDAPAPRGDMAPAPGTVGFQGVPREVWEFRIGAYQVCLKWLKDRKGRVLAPSAIAEYAGMVGIISETIRLTGRVDATIEQFGGWPQAFSGSA